MEVSEHEGQLPPARTGQGESHQKHARGRKGSPSQQAGQPGWGTQEGSRNPGPGEGQHGLGSWLARLGTWKLIAQSSLIRNPDGSSSTEQHRKAESDKMITGIHTTFQTRHKSG